MNATTTPRPGQAAAHPAPLAQRLAAAFGLVELHDPAIDGFLHDILTEGRAATQIEGEQSPVGLLTAALVDWNDLAEAVSSEPPKTEADKQQFDNVFAEIRAEYERGISAANLHDDWSLEQDEWFDFEFLPAAQAMVTATQSRDPSATAAAETQLAQAGVRVEHYTPVALDLAPRADGRTFTVLARWNGLEFRDAINVDSAYHRDQWLKRLSTTFGVPVRWLSHLPRELIQKATQESRQAEPVTFDRITCAELDATKYALEYLIEWTLLRGQPCILAGPKKTLKTSIAIDLGISLAMGTPFLGRLHIPRAARVGIMSGESGMPVIQETGRRVAAAAGYRLGDISNLIFSQSLPWLPSQCHLDALTKFITDDELEVLVIDPAYLAMPGDDAGNLFKQGSLLRGLNEVTTETGCTIILCHHCKKLLANPLDPPELENIAWSGFQEWCRQWLLLGRREGYQPGSGEHKLWLNVGGSAGHSALWALDIWEGTIDSLAGRCWQVELIKPDQAREALQEQQEAEREQRHRDAFERDKERLLRALAKHPAGETKNVLKTWAGLAGDRFNMVLASLLDEGTAVETEIPKNNRPCAAYRLSEDQP